jgi:hypothetical protein
MVPLLLTPTNSNSPKPKFRPLSPGDKIDVCFNNNNLPNAPIDKCARNSAQTYTDTDTDTYTDTDTDTDTDTYTDTDTDTSTDTDTYCCIHCPHCDKSIASDMFCCDECDKALYDRSSSSNGGACRCKECNELCASELLVKKYFCSKVCGKKCKQREKEEKEEMEEMKREYIRRHSYDEMELCRCVVCKYSSYTSCGGAFYCCDRCDRCDDYDSDDSCYSCDSDDSRDGYDGYDRYYGM